MKVENQVQIAMGKLKHFYIKFSVFTSKVQRIAQHGACHVRKLMWRSLKDSYAFVRGCFIFIIELLNFPWPLSSF